MDYGLFLKIANTGNDTKLGHRCPIQIAYRIWQFSKDISISEASFYVRPDEPIVACSSIYCGITEDLLKSPDSIVVLLEEAISRTSRLIRKISNKNIYVIGWDVPGDTLEVLENNAKRLNIDTFDIQKLKIIDLKKLADLSLPINETGHLGPDTTLFWLEKKVNNSSDNDTFKLLDNIRNSRWQAKFCMTTLDMDLMILKRFMSFLNLQTIDEVYDWLESPHKIKVLQFGKHKGELISDVYVKDNEYLCWLYSCKDIMDKNKDLKFTLDSLFAI